MPGMDNAHALVIGIANYQHINNLPPTVLKDAQDVHDLLLDPEHCGYAPENVYVLLDDQATQAAIHQALADLAACSGPDSTVLFYISSHGGRVESGPHAGEYLLPVNALYASDESLAETAISGDAFTEALRAIPARKMVVIFDCCHAGGIGQPKDALAPMLKTGFSERYYETLKAGIGRVILASSRSNEYAYVRLGAENSLFAQHLLAGLRGGAPGPGGLIRIFDLFRYLQPRVTEAQPRQHPLFKAEVEENFPVALYSGGRAPMPLPSVPEDDFVFDVFISYRHREPDRSWVRKTLRPRLEAKGLRVCVDYRDFRLGAPLVLEMARAVEQSRYTLAVLSPAYLDSTFTELENVLAEHLGLEEGQRRLLAVMHQACKPRLGMRARLWLDMTDDDAFDANVARLIYELRLAPDA